MSNLYRIILCCVVRQTCKTFVSYKLIMPINSAPPNAAYMHQWIGSALVRILVCRLFGAKPLSKPMLCYCQLVLSNKFQWIFKQNTKLFTHENVSESVDCEFFLSRRIWVNFYYSVVIDYSISNITRFQMLPIKSLFVRTNIVNHKHTHTHIHMRRKHYHLAIAVIIIGSTSLELKGNVQLYWPPMVPRGVATRCLWTTCI